MEQKAIEQVKQFLNAWKSKRLESMYELSQLSWKSENTLEDIKMLFSDLKLKSYEVVGIRQLGAALISVATEMKINGEVAVSAINVVFETGVYNANPDGSPGVNPLSALRFKIVRESE